MLLYTDSVGEVGRRHGVESHFPDVRRKRRVVLYGEPQDR